MTALSPTSASRILTIPQAVGQDIDSMGFGNDTLDIWPGMDMAKAAMFGSRKVLDPDGVDCSYSPDVISYSPLVFDLEPVDPPYVAAVAFAMDEFPAYVYPWELFTLLGTTGVTLAVSARAKLVWEPGPAGCLITKFLVSGKPSQSLWSDAGNALHVLVWKHDGTHHQAATADMTASAVASTFLYRGPYIEAYDPIPAGAKILGMWVWDGVNLPDEDPSGMTALRETALAIARYFEGAGRWSLRQRQTGTGNAGGWPLRGRQNQGQTGSWPLRH